MGTENVKLGVCNVTYGGTDLGLTKGGVEVEVTTDTHKVMVDQYGESEINEQIVKRSIKVTVPMAETTLDNMVLIMPGATKVGSDPYRVDVTNAVGTDLLSIANELVIHPVALAANDHSEDIIVPKAATGGAMAFAYKLNDERIFNVVFTGYPDSNDILFKFGDPAAA